MSKIAVAEKDVEAGREYSGGRVIGVRPVSIRRYRVFLNSGAALRGPVARAVAAFAVGSMLLVGCSSTDARAPVSLPAPKSGEVTFYLSLPSSTGELGKAAIAVAKPGTSQYRRFSSLDSAAGRFGATDEQINAVARSVSTLGLRFVADPTRLFGRVIGSTGQWQAALGTPLTQQAATAKSPFITYGLPRRVPPALEPPGTSLLLPEVLVYDPGAEGSRPPSGSRPTSNPAAPAPASVEAFQPWPSNTGTPIVANCSSPLLRQRRVYSPHQVQTAYGVDTLRSSSSGRPVITVLDLGGGWLPGDLELAGRCFGYAPPEVTQSQGDGVATTIAHGDDETSLDLQTAAAVAPGAEVRLVQSTPAGILDVFSRAVGDSHGRPDVVSLSYGDCAFAEVQDLPEYTSVINAVLAMAALTGVSSFVAAGDHGSTTCGTSVPGTTLSYPAVSPFVTAVGGTRLTLGGGNSRTTEVVWNDSVYGSAAAGGGGISLRQPRPAYQDGANAQSTRAVPDVSALADTVPGWPVVINSRLQTVGGTSGSTPFIAAATALVAASERAAGRPSVGLANGWFYQAASRPSAFFDVTEGNNDLGRVGCCEAAAGYDAASGLGVPNWAVLPGTLAAPG